MNPLSQWIQAKTGQNIEQYQIERIRHTLRYAADKSPFYRALYRAIDIESVRSFTDFERIPLIAAETLISSGLDMLCTAQHEIERIVTLQTSGTSGEPKRVYFTAEDQELTVDFFHHGMQCLIDAKDRLMILLPWRTPGSVGDLLRRGLARLGCGVYPYGLIEDYQDAGAFMMKHGITSLVANPVQALRLAEISRLQGYEIRLKSILLSTDYVPDSIVKRISNIWKCDVYEHYGMTEMCFGGGVFCGYRKGYHMREADLYFEIVSEHGEVLPDGVYGEVVFTTLTRAGMPLIRYRTGDYGRFLKERCACGDTLKLMEKLRRRVDGGIRRRDGRMLYMSDFDELLFSYEGLVDYELEYHNEMLFVTLHVIQENAGTMEAGNDHIDKNISKDEKRGVYICEQSIYERIREDMGIEAHITVQKETGAPQGKLIKRRIEGAFNR